MSATHETITVSLSCKKLHVFVFTMSFQACLFPVSVESSRGQYKQKEDGLYSDERLKINTSVVFTQTLFLGLKTL